MRYKIPAALYFCALTEPCPLTNVCEARHTIAPFVGGGYGGLGNQYLETLHVTEFR
jgi:hypothetical protein